MNVNRMIKDLIELQAQGKGELPIYIIDGHNGMSEASNGAYLSVRDENDDGGLLDLEEGKEYVAISFG